MAVKGNGGRWLGGVDKVMVVAGVRDRAPGGGSWGLKAQNPSMVAWYRVYQVKPRSRAMGGGAEVLWKWWW
jgi:hypothetical protein